MTEKTLHLSPWEVLALTEALRAHLPQINRLQGQNLLDTLEDAVAIKVVMRERAK